MTQYRRRRRLGKAQILAVSHWHRCGTCGATRRVLNSNCVGYHGEAVCIDRCKAGCEVPVD